MATLETRQFNLLAWVLSICVLVLLGGAVWALVTERITFTVFAAAVGVPLGPLVGWAARGAVIPK